MKGRFATLLRASCLLPVWALVPSQAAAQGNPEGTAAREGQSDDNEIVITARRREESLQDTPVAVTVFSGASLERQQIVGTTELDQVAPNLQFATYGTLTGNNSAAQVFIRGIGQTDATPAVDPGVGIYIDDVYMGRSIGGAMEFRDIASVQVLRGPQGTLFGRNTIGGAVLLTSNAPGAGAGNTVRVGYGTDDLFEAFGAFDIPLGDQWSARISAGYRRRDGYVTRIFDGVDLGDENTYSGQLALRWQPSDSVTFTLRGDYAHEDENGSPFVFRAMNERATFPAAQSVAAGCPGATFPPPFVPSTPTRDPRCGNDSQALGPFTNGGTYPATSSLENYGVSFVAEWEANEVLTFKSITARRHLEWSGTRDADNTPLLILHTNYSSESNQFSQEFQALIETGRLHGVAGLYYFNEETFDRVIVPVGNPGTSYDTQRVSLESKAYAAFTQWTFDITESLSVTAGIRYTDETKSLQGILFNVAPASAAEPATPPTNICPFNGAPPTQTGCLFLTTNQFERSFSATTASASIQYRFSPAIMTYLSWSQGFKSGGFNQRYNAAPPGNAADLLRLRAGGDLRTRSQVESGAADAFQHCPVQHILRRYPADLPARRRAAAVQRGRRDDPRCRVRVRMDAGYGSAARCDAWAGSTTSSTASSIRRPSAAVSPTAVATLASRLPFTPEWTAHIGMSYTFRFGDGWRLTPRVDLSYTDNQFFDAGNSPEIAQSDVTVLNAGVALEHGRWRVALNIYNLTDELYPVAGTSSLTTASGYAEIIYARPRNFTLSASMNF